MQKKGIPSICLRRHGGSKWHAWASDPCLPISKVIFINIQYSIQEFSALLQLSICLSVFMIISREWRTRVKDMAWQLFNVFVTHIFEVLRYYWVYLYYIYAYHTLIGKLLFNHCCNIDAIKFIKQVAKYKFLRWKPLFLSIHSFNRSRLKHTVLKRYSYL